MKKLRLAFILLGLSVIAFISTAFGMLMAVASDLPSLETKAAYQRSENSVLYPATGKKCEDPSPAREAQCPRIAQLADAQNRILVDEGEVSPYIKNAVIAIEDRRFYSHEGVDYTGIARALWQDIRQGAAVQGGSTITQQFVKNALADQPERSVFQKLKESALAYHLERNWSKEKILTQYLNTVYFGNGAYGVESAVRTYFGDGDSADAAATDAAGVSAAPLAPEDPAPPDPERRESRDVAPEEAALLAAMIASPSLYDPVENPKAATRRRNIVLKAMLEQGTLNRAQYEEAVEQEVPGEGDIDPPKVESTQPYFTTWVTQHLIEEFKAGKVFGGGLAVKTTLDAEYQQAAEEAVAGRLAGLGPSASLVAIDNDTGQVKAMVGGSDFDSRPFNLATNGHRQPGSAFKPFILARALADGIDPNSTWESAPQRLPFQGKKGPEIFEVSNYEDAYLGAASLWSATTTSDNAVFAQLGMEVKPRRVARLARKLGVKTKLSTNPAMLLGGLDQGVTPLEMAYAYSTIANDGVRVSGDLAYRDRGPVGIEKVSGDAVPGGEKVNQPIRTQVLKPEVAQKTKEMLSLVVSSGTGEAAQVEGEELWGKTGTTSNYADAWFVGANKEMTVAVWVGYPDKLQPMETEHAGGPVAGGTFPAEIFQDFMTSYVALRDLRRADRDGDGVADPDRTPDAVLPTDPLPTDPAAPPEETAPEDEALPDEGGTGGGDGGGDAPAPEAPAPETPPTPAPAPQPSPSPPPEGGGTGGGTTPAPGAGE